MITERRSLVHAVHMLLVAAALAMAGTLRAQDPIKVFNLSLRERNNQFTVGQKLVLPVNQQDLQRVGGARAVRVRVLRGTQQQLLALANGGGDDCVVLWSLVSDVGQKGIQLSSNVQFTNDWLDYQGGSGLDEAYLVVFEDKTTGSSVLRVRRGDWRSYVQQGHQIYVGPDGNSPPPRPSRPYRPGSARAATVSSGATAPSRPVAEEPCRRVLATLDGNIQLAAVTCGVEADPPSPKG